MAKTKGNYKNEGVELEIVEVEHYQNSVNA